MKKKFTGMLDADGEFIYEGDLLSTGMKRGYEGGWTTEIIQKKPLLKRLREKWNGREFWSDYELLHPINKEPMAMVLDQQLRKLIKK